MKAIVAAFGAGFAFAVGLAVSGMTLPQKVVGFLDVSGDWDPSLALVMVGAIGVYLPAWLLIRRRRRPVLAQRFSTPDKAGVDGRVLLGSAIFGLGWGLSGFCPGPGIVSSGAGSLGAVLFVLAMLGGSALARAMLAPAPQVARSAELSQLARQQQPPA